jgi:hypothetical protein
LDEVVQVVETTWVISLGFIPASSIARRAAETARATPSLANISEIVLIVGTVAWLKIGELQGTASERVFTPELRFIAIVLSKLKKKARQKREWLKQELNYAGECLYSSYAVFSSSSAGTRVGGYATPMPVILSVGLADISHKEQ